MKKTTTLCLVISLMLGTGATAQADWGRRDGYNRPHQQDYGRHYDHGYRSSRGWGGPAALLAITGLAIGAAVYSQANAAPVYAAPVYIPPPRQVEAAPASGNWYYCGSSGQYYPYVRYCDEGWQSVMPPRQ